MSYHVWIKDEAKSEIRQLPDHMRQRVRQAIRDLSLEPHPHDSQPMKSPIATELELRRLRLDRWRVIYIVDDQAQEVGVLAVRKRPPYDYSDLASLLEGIEA